MRAPVRFELVKVHAEAQTRKEKTQWKTGRSRLFLGAFARLRENE